MSVINATSEALIRAVPMAVDVDGNTIGNWLIDNVIFVFIVIIAITILTAAVTKKPRDAMIAFGITLLALLLISLAAFRVELGDWVRTTFFGG
jgi:CHASE2 domain-containing sensor protein